MRKQRLLMFLMLIVCMGLSQVEAKKIKYGTLVYYDGKAKGDMPLGEGMLRTCVNASSEKPEKTDFWEDLTGTFNEDGTVTGATITFASCWTFVGTLKYEVAPDGSSVTYTLTEGKLGVLDGFAVMKKDKDNAFFSIQIDPKHPLTIVRKPKLKMSEVSVSSYNIIRPAMNYYSNTYAAPVLLNDVGDYAEAQAYITWKIQQYSLEALNKNKSSFNNNLKSLLGLDICEEPWFVSRTLEKFAWSNGNEITCSKIDKDWNEWNIKTQKGIFTYFNRNTENSTKSKADSEDPSMDIKPSIIRFILQYADGSMQYDDNDKALTVFNADKTKWEGTLRMEAGKVVLNKNKSISDYDIREVYTAFAKANGLASLNIKPIDAKKLDANGNIIEEYKYGISTKVLKERAEALNKAREAGQPYAAEQTDVLGTWTWSDPNQLMNTVSSYSLDLTEDGHAKLSQEMFFYDYSSLPAYSYGGNNASYYLPRHNTVEGSYKLSDNQLIFTWDSPTIGQLEISESGVSIIKGSSLADVTSNIQSDVRNSLNKSENDFKAFIKDIANVTITNATETQLVINDGAHQWLRSEFAAASARKLEERRAKDFSLKTIVEKQNVMGFHQVYADGEITYERKALNSNVGTATISYINGDKFVGDVEFGDINLYHGRSIIKKVLELQSIHDYPIAYISGTLTTAKGEEIKYQDYMTENQINGVANNLNVFAQKLQETQRQEAANLKPKCLATKAKLLEEGFSAYYVNSMFDQFCILQGTPRSLVDRAIQLGCHIERHEYTMTETDTRDTFYAIHITNYNNGNAAFDGFIKFDYWTDRVNYVGTTMY